jgi:periplasmic protein TonB
LIFSAVSELETLTFCSQPKLQSGKLDIVVFNGLQPTSSGLRRHRAVGVSVAAHLALLAAIVFHNPRVIDLSPTWFAYGDSVRTYRITYFPPHGANDAPEAAKLMFPPRANQPRPRPQPPKQAPKPHELLADAEASDHNSRAGSPLGTMIDGPIAGHEVHVAYPVVYPDPPVNRAELPRDLSGDVVIEVTIDSAGNVVETRIVQAIGHGIDEKIEATLRRWHFQPATLDGTPVATRHDVHFHFPS